jgi:hypothetical protein
MQNPERMKMQIMEGLRVYVKGNAMKKYREISLRWSSDFEEMLGNLKKRQMIIRSSLFSSTKLLYVHVACFHFVLTSSDVRR